MKGFKKIAAIAAVMGIFVSAGAAYAATNFKTPAQIAADVTGKTVEQVTEERSDGKTYGTIAKDAGKLDEFKAQMLEQKKAVLDQRVKDGTLTQQQADEIYNAVKNNQATCDGTGNAAIGKKYGAGFGMGGRAGCGRGAGNGMGLGSCSGYGSGK